MVKYTKSARMEYMDKKRIELYKILYEYLLVIRKPFVDFLYKHMKNVNEINWWTKFVSPYVKEPYKKNLDDLDMYDLLNILISNWGELYNSINKNNEYIYVYDQNFKLINDMLFLRNIVSHANENNIFYNDIYKQLAILLNFANFINAYEYIIISLRNDLDKYKKEKYNNDEIKKENLLDVIIPEVLFKAMICTDLSTETKTSILRTTIIIKNMKTADEIYDFYTGALQSSKGHWVYKNLKEKNLTTFEDIRDKINNIMNS